MIRTPVAAFALVGLTVACHAAPQPERVRGTVVSATDTAVVIKGQDGQARTVTLTPDTKFSYVVKSSLDNVSDGKFIGTATKGEPPVALEVVIFPPAMKGTGEGHYDWDAITDTTAQAKGLTKSAMTNGTIKSSSGSGAMTKSTMTSGTATNGGAMTSKDTMTRSSMTNGTVKTGTGTGGGKTITVTYGNGGQQEITVPPTAPIVEFEPADKSIVKPGAVVFSSTLKDGDTLTARSVNVGKDGVVPPM